MFGDIAPKPLSSEDRVSAPRRPAEERVRESFFESVRRITFGLVTARGWSLWVGPVKMLGFSAPYRHGDGWYWDIGRGLLARAPGGRFGYEWSEGVLYGRVEGYHALLPFPIYRWTQLPFHHLVTRLFLLQLRGRHPAPGIPAEPALRLLAGVGDLAACGALAHLLGRRRFAAWFSLAVIGYHLGWWSTAGWTPVGRLLGQRLVAVDGSRATPGQALVRLLALPRALSKLRALHDEAAGTEVIKSP